MSSKPTFTSVLSNRGFRYLWLNQILVQLAYNSLNFALIIWVYKLVGMNLAVSGLMLAVYLPALIFGLFAGVIVDITDRRRIIFTIDLLLAGAFLVFIFIKHSYPLILLNTFFINSLAQFFVPSENSSIPKLVSPKQLFLANSLFSLTLYGTFMIGFSVGGPILNHLGINALFYLGAGVLVLAFILARNLPSIRPAVVSKEFEGFLSAQKMRQMIRLTSLEVGETLKFIFRKLNIAVTITLLALVQGVVGILAVMMPSYLEKVLLIHATDLSYFVILPLGLGMVSGAILLGRLAAGRPRRSVVIPAIIGAGLLFILVGIVPTVAHVFQSADLPSYITQPRYFFRAPSLSTFFGFLAYLLGFCMVSIIIPCQTVLQENTTEKNRGKIFSVLVVLMTAFSALPVIVAGGLADLFGVTPIFTGLGLIILALGIVALRPQLFFHEQKLPGRVKEFLGVGHWGD